MEQDRGKRMSGLTICMSLRGHGPDSASCCSSLRPPEVWVQVHHSGAAAPSAHPGVHPGGPEAVELGRRLMFWPREGVVQMQRILTLQLTELWSGCWLPGLSASVLKLVHVLGPHSVPLGGWGNSGSSGELWRRQRFLLATLAPIPLASGFPEGAGEGCGNEQPCLVPHPLKSKGHSRRMQVSSMY